MKDWLRRLLSRVDPGYLVLLLVCVMSLSIRVWLLDKRWINPDEGAHLMDAVFVLDGKIPHVDFASRELIYVYSMAGLLKLFGADYVVGRLLPITCSLLVGIVVYLLATELFDRKVGLLASVTYWVLPLEVTQSVLVQTEPLVSLLSCLAFYGAARFSRHGRGSWLIVAGLFSALGFYARPSAIIVPVAIAVFIVLFHAGRLRELAERLGLFLVGYGAVVLCVLGHYSRFVSPRALWWEFNPVGWAAGMAVSALGWSSKSIAAPLFATQASLVSLSWRYLHEAVSFNSFLILALGFSILEGGYGLFTQDVSKKQGSLAATSLLYLWLFFLFGAYAFYAFLRAFFIDYSREFLPPLVIVLSAWVMKSLPSLGRERVLEWFVLGGLCLSGSLFLIQGHYPHSFGIGHHASLAIALIALFFYAGGFTTPSRRVVFVSILSGLAAFIVLSREEPWKGYLSGAAPSLAMIGLIYSVTWTLARPSLREYWRFVCLSIVLAALVVSVSFSAILLGRTYHAVWSPQLVRRIASDLKAQTASADEVMSGGVIWELQASRRPFQMISHPLALRITPEQTALIEGALATRPPKAIILDGYTELTYMRVPGLAEFVNARYQSESPAGPAVYPVRLYWLKKGSLASDGPRQ